MEDMTTGQEGLDTPQITIERLKAALKGMEALRQVVERKVAALNAMTDEELKGADLSQMQRELGKAVQSVVVEEGKASDAIRQQCGGGGIDFDAARAAIRGRLDRIRAAGDAGSVLERSD